jgi:O-antigen ligase
MDSIMNAEEDPTGSRAARLRLFDQGVQVFLDNPVTGIGAGQFQNYIAPGIVEKWRVTHNVWLQVAAELGLFGLMIFAFLVMRAYSSSFAALRMLRLSHRRGPRDGLRASKAAARPEDPYNLSAEERRILDINAKGMLAAMVGWTVCSLFASVAFNWTFYYVFALAVSGREILRARRAATVEEPAARRAGAARLVRATA